MARFIRLALAGGLFLPSAAGAVFLTPTAKQVEEALELGRTSVSQERFGEEWEVAVKDESVTVVTPFSRLALAARNAAFKRESLAAAEVRKILDRGKGRIHFLAALRGTQAEFARFYEGVLLVKGKEVKPVFVQNERTAAPLEEGGFLARCLYVFPTDGLDPRGEVTLVVRLPKGGEVFRAAIDLGSMR
jgi:hypothetical protein